MQIAIDDGYAYTKLAWFEDGAIRTFSLRSSAQPGVHGITNLDGEPVHAYESDGQRFTVGPVLNPESTMFEEYAFSPLNRCIIHHALIEGGAPLGESIHAGLTLPMNVFYKVEGVRQRRVDALLTHPVACVSNKDVVLPKFQSAKVFPEGAVAWIDAYVNEDGTEARPLDDIGPVAVVDIGGKTTDTAIFPRKGMIDQEKSGTDNVGVMTVMDRISTALMKKFDMTTIGSGQVDRALRTGVVHIFGEKDVSDIVASAKEQVADEIWRALARRLTNASEFEEILFVGGGAEVLGPFLINRKEFPLARVLPNPQFANARGVLKYMTFVDAE
jgi:plasmid segregation protein ParM